MTYYLYFIPFAIIFYIMLVDKNVAEYILLIFKIIRVNFERSLWMIRFHPFWIRNPIGKWWYARKYEKMIRELQTPEKPSTDS